MSPDNNNSEKKKDELEKEKQSTLELNTKIELSSFDLFEISLDRTYNDFGNQSKTTPQELDFFFFYKKGEIQAPPIIKTTEN